MQKHADTLPGLPCNGGSAERVREGVPFVGRADYSICVGVKTENLQNESTGDVNALDCGRQNKKRGRGDEVDMPSFERVTTKAHCCGVQRLGFLALGIQRTPENEHMYVRQWTRDCSNEPEPLVFDVDGKPLANPADAYGSMPAIDAMKCSGLKKTQAKVNAKPDEIMKLGIDRRDIYLIYFDGDTGVRFAKMEIMFIFLLNFSNLYHGSN
tara:strand:- start:440 stop:1072 length:633 start_codon:yes stop_codon:yes gene_type:complete